MLEAELEIVELALEIIGDLLPLADLVRGLAHPQALLGQQVLEDAHQVLQPLRVL